MYVDKPLTGLAAVQTLSRLNRIHPSKSDTFVLDFRNDHEDIQKAFEPYYGRTVAPPTDANLLWDTRHRLDQYDLLRPDEIEATVAVLARVATSARRITLHLPKSWPWETAWTALFDRVCDPPPLRTA